MTEPFITKYNGVPLNSSVFEQKRKLPMKPEIIFFDIDGTILPIGEKFVHSAVVKTLQDLHDKGVRLFIATGRAPYELPDLTGIPFDGMMCFNGSYCCDDNGVIFSEPMETDDIRMVIRNAGSLGLPVTLATAERMGSNFYQQNLADYIAISCKEYHIPDDFEQFLKEPVYQLMVGATADLDEHLVRNVPNAKIARWWDRATDIIPARCGKAVGAEKILEYYGLTAEDAMAFGDGGNDAELLSYVGIGIAMGNAEDDVKDAADYVTDSCEEDGVVSALAYYGLI